MSRKKTPAAPGKPTMARWPIPAAGAIIAVMLGCAALAATSSVPTAAQPPASVPATDLAGPKSVTQAEPPAPKIGAPYLADLGGGLVAKVTIKSAAFTAPDVLTLDVDWDSWAGTTTPDPGRFQVLDASGTRAAAHTLTDGALPGSPVQPGQPVHGKVAFDVPAGPATLVIQPSGAKAPTRITVGR